MSLPNAVQYLKNIRNNVRNIKTGLKQKTKPKSSSSNAEYNKYISDIAAHCFPKENSNRAKSIVDFTIRKIAEGNNHNAGKLKNINHVKFAKQVHAKIYEPQQCGMFTAFAHAFVSFEHKTKRKQNVSKKVM